MQLKLMTEQPTIIIIMNETFLDNSTPSIDLDGYVLISRRDRQDGSGWGGICCFARRDFQYCIVEILRSNIAERIWHVMHTSCGPYILGIQYRRPHTGEVDSILSLEGELQQIQEQAFGIILVGDFNVHSIRWLKFSSHESSEASALQQICQKFSFVKCVQRSTRGNHLLDLILSDIADYIDISILPPVANHNMILIHFAKHFDIEPAEMRQIFDYKFAN